jgi:hypothetical protein
MWIYSLFAVSTCAWLRHIDMDMDVDVDVDMLHVVAPN